MQSKKITQLATEINPLPSDLTFTGDAITGQLKKISWSQLTTLFSNTYNLQDVTDNGNSTTNSIIVNGLTLTGMATGVLKSTNGVVSSIGLGTANGVATLDSSAKVPSSQLPSYVDDVLEYANLASLPTTGETGKIYITLDTNKVYRWSGSVYVEVSSGTAVWGSITGTLANQTDLKTALDGKYSTSNPAGYITGITSTMVTDALGFTPYNATNPSGYITGISSTMVTDALGYTPYNSTNPAGYITGITSTMIKNALGLNSNSAVTTGSTGQLVASITTATEIAYLSGVSSNIQTQLDGKAASFVVGPAISSPSSVLNITGSGAFVGGSLTFTINQASSTQSGYLSSADWIRFNDYATGNYLPISGGTLTGALNIDIDGNTPLQVRGTEPYMEIIAKGGSNTAGIAIYPTSGYDAAIGNFNNGALNLMASSKRVAQAFITDGTIAKFRVGEGNDFALMSVMASNFGAGYEGGLGGNNADGNTHFYTRHNNSTFGDIGYFNYSGLYMVGYGSYSDIRLKDVHETNPISNLDSLDVIKYSFKSNPNVIRYGYSAQQVKELMPDLVSTNLPIGGTEEDGTYSLNYNDLHTLKIAALEKRIKELENKLN